MSTSELVSIDRSIWEQGGPAIEATSLPTALFVLPTGVIDIDAMIRHADAHPISGIRITDARRIDITDDTTQCVYKAVVGRGDGQEESYWCTSTYVRFKRRLRLVSHQRSAAV